jgi:hypothetical protein
MWEGTTGLAATFVVIASVLLWLFIKPDTKNWIKAIVIPFVIWFGFAAYYTPQNLMGWPTSVALEDVPGNSIVQEILIIEPNSKDAGAMYFWLIPLDKDPDRLFWSPKHAFVYNSSPGEPRVYKTPYDKELHQKLIKAQKEKKKHKGSILMFDGLLKGKKGQPNAAEGQMKESKSPFRLLKPQDIFKK